MKTTTDTKYQIPIVRKTFDLLELLIQYPSGLTMQEIMNKRKQPKTTLFRLLSSLYEMGYLGKNNETQQFYLSRKFLRIGLAALGESNIVEQSLPPMRALRDEIKESIMLGVFMDNKVVLLEQVLGSHNFTFLLRPGTDFCLHASAPGKLFLAYLPSKELRQILTQINYTPFNERTITCEEQLQTELTTIRQNGYAVDLEEEMSGVHCIAAPIFNQFGYITATIWTSGPSGRLTQKLFPEIGQKLIDTANKISSNLGFVPNSDQLNYSKI